MKAEKPITTAIKMISGRASHIRIVEEKPNYDEKLGDKLREIVENQIKQKYEQKIKELEARLSSKVPPVKDVTNKPIQTYDVECACCQMNRKNFEKVVKKIQEDNYFFGVEMERERNKEQLAEKEQKIKELGGVISDLETEVAEKDKQIIMLERRIGELEKRIKSHSDDEFQFGVNEVRQQAIQSERERLIKAVSEHSLYSEILGHKIITEKVVLELIKGMRCPRCEGNMRKLTETSHQCTSCGFVWEKA